MWPNKSHFLPSVFNINNKSILIMNFLSQGNFENKVKTVWIIEIGYSFIQQPVQNSKRKLTKRRESADVADSDQDG